MAEEVSNIYFGTPSVSFIPARQYKMKDAGELKVLALPLRGRFPEGETPFTGEFNLSPEPGVIAFGDVLKVMGFLNVYPKLEDNQKFIINTIELKPNILCVVGRVVEFLED